MKPKTTFNFYTSIKSLRNSIKALTSPLPIYFLLVALVFVLYTVGLEAIAYWIFVFSFFYLVLISTPWVPEALLASLENQYQHILQPQQYNNIVKNGNEIHLHVLGAGDSNDSRLSYTSQLHVSSLYRITEAIRLHNAISGSKIVLTGNSGTGTIPQAEFYSHAAQELGIDKSNINIIAEGWNTHHEAVAYHKQFGTKHKHFLITDAVHMPRAMMIFKSVGLSPIPAPTHYRLRQNNYKRQITDYFPSSHYITYSEIVLQAYLGVLWAKIRGIG